MTKLEAQIVCEECEEMRPFDRTSIQNGKFICDWCAVKELKKDQELKTIFDQYQNKEHWKNEATVFTDDKELALKIKEAFQFFHGVRATINAVSIAVPIHGDALVKIAKVVYQITTPGYGC